MFCRQCGKQLVDGASFCAYCGVGTSGQAAAHAAESPAKKSFRRLLRAGFWGVAAVLYVIALVQLLMAAESWVNDRRDFPLVLFNGFLFLTLAAAGGLLASAFRPPWKERAVWSRLLNGGAAAIGVLGMVVAVGIGMVPPAVEPPPADSPPVAHPDPTIARILTNLQSPDGMVRFEALVDAEEIPSPPPELRDAVLSAANSDSDEEVRVLAQALLKKWEVGQGLPKR